MSQNRIHILPLFTSLFLAFSCSVIEMEDITVPSEASLQGEEREYRVGSIKGAEYDIAPVVTKTVIADATGGSDVNIHIYEHDGAYLGTWNGGSTTSIRLNTAKKYDFYLESGYVKSTIDGSAAFPAATSTAMRNAVYQGDAFRSSVWTSYPTSGNGRFYNAMAGEYGGKIPTASSYLNMTPTELDAADGSTDGVFNLEVERLFAKINFTVRISPELKKEMKVGNGSIKIKEVYLVNIPRICNMFEDPNDILDDDPLGWSSIYGWNTATENSNFIKSMGDCVLLPTPQTISLYGTGTYSCTLYAPENLTGEDDGLGDYLADEAVDSDLGKSRTYTSKAECATRIVVVVEYNNGLNSEGDVTYTYWPGLQSTDFSIIRNTQYNVTLTFTPDGFDITDSWRVDTSSWSIENTEIDWDNTSTTTLWTNQYVDEEYWTEGPSLDNPWCGVRITQLSGTSTSIGGGLIQEGAENGIHYAETSNSPYINYDESYVTFYAYNPEYNGDYSNYRSYTGNWTDQTFRVAFESPYKFIETGGNYSKNITVKHAYIRIGDTIENELEEPLPSGTWSYDSSTRTFTVRQAAFQEFEAYMGLFVEYKGPYAPKLYVEFYGEWASDYPEEDDVIIFERNSYPSVGSHSNDYIQIFDEERTFSTSFRYADIYAYIGTDFAHALVYDKVRYVNDFGAEDYAAFVGRTTYSIYQGQSVDIDIDYYDEDENWIEVAWASGSTYPNVNTWKFYINGNLISDGMTWNGLTFTYDDADGDDESWTVTAGASATPGTYTLRTRTANVGVRYATLRVKAAGGSGAGGSDDESEQDNDY